MTSLSATVQLYTYYKGQTGQARRAGIVLQKTRSIILLQYRGATVNSSKARPKIIGGHLNWKVLLLQPPNLGKTEVLLVLPIWWHPYTVVVVNSHAILSRDPCCVLTFEMTFCCLYSVLYGRATGFPMVVSNGRSWSNKGVISRKSRIEMSMIVARNFQLPTSGA